MRQPADASADRMFPQLTVSHFLSCLPCRAIMIGWVDSRRMGE
jgi:hypothetical protein